MKNLTLEWKVASLFSSKEKASCKNTGIRDIYIYMENKWYSRELSVKKLQTLREP